MKQFGNYEDREGPKHDPLRALYLQLTCEDGGLNSLDFTDSTILFNEKRIQVAAVSSPACNTFEFYKEAVMNKIMTAETQNESIFIVVKDENEDNQIISYGPLNLAVPFYQHEYKAGWVNDEQSPIHNWLVRKFETSEGQKAWVALRPPADL